jgi:hypothetical protein
MIKYIMPLCIAGLTFTLAHILSLTSTDPRAKGQMVIVARPLGLNTDLGGVITSSTAHTSFLCKPHSLSFSGFAIASPCCYSKNTRLNTPITTGINTLFVPPVIPPTCPNYSFLKAT